MRAPIRSLPAAVLATALLAATPAGALTEVAAVPVDLGPYLVAVDPVADKVYTAHPIEGTVSVVDVGGPAPSLTAVVPAGAGAYGIDVNPSTGKVYVGNFFADSVTVIDPSGAMPPVTIPGIPGAGGVAVDVAENLVYVIAAHTSDVHVIDGTTDSPVGVITDVAPDGAAFLIELNPLLKRLYVPAWPSGLLYTVDLLTGLPIPPAGPFPGFGYGLGLGGVAIHPITQMIYVTNEKGGIYMLDPLTHTVLRSHPVMVPGVLPFGTWGVQVNALKNHVYVAQFHSDSVHVLDALTLAPVGVVFTGIPDGGPDAGPHFTALHPDSGDLYVSNEFAATLSVITDP